MAFDGAIDRARLDIDDPQWHRRSSSAARADVYWMEAQQRRMEKTARRNADRIFNRKLDRALKLYLCLMPVLFLAGIAVMGPFAFALLLPVVIRLLRKAPDELVKAEYRKLYEAAHPDWVELLRKFSKLSGEHNGF